jgi:hypothetical protein
MVLLLVTLTASACAGGMPAPPGTSNTTDPAGTAGNQGDDGSGSAGTGAPNDPGLPGFAGSSVVDAGAPLVDAGIADEDVSPPSDGGYTGRLVTIQIKDAIVAPGKADGSNWDGLGKVDSSVVQAVAAALLESDPAAKVVAALANPVLGNVDKPDPYGTAQLTAYGMTFAPDVRVTRDSAIRDTFTPIFPSTFAYKNVPIDTDVRISVDLWDKDLLDDDPIGDAEINSTDLRAALAAQNKYEVRVDGQTDGQLLFVGIEVVQQEDAE